MDATADLARFAKDLDYDALPPNAVRMATNVVLDTVASALSGATARGIGELTELMAGFSSGPSRVWFSDSRISPFAATLVNSSMAHALEFDDLHEELPTHSGIVVVPAAIAVAETVPNATGRDLIAAVVAGTEILNRLARANRSYRGTKGFRGWNPTSVIAGFATAAVAGRLLGLDAAGIANAMGLSYAQAGGNQQCIADGGLVKRMQPGIVAEAGVRAAWLSRAGITGAIDALEGKNGYFNLYEAGDYDRAFLLASHENRLEIERVCFKRYPVCGMAQPAMDCLRDLQRQHGFTTGQVAEVAAEGSRFVVDMVGRPYRPGSNPEVDAQFNLPYCLATILETEDFGLADLAPEKTLDANRRKRADAIPIRLDDSLSGKWEARVTVTLTSGERLSATRRVAAWQDDRPMERDDLVAKLRDAADTAGLDRARTDALAQALTGLPDLRDLGPLTRALAP